MPYCFYFIFGPDPDRPHLFYNGLPVDHCLGKGHGPAHHQRMRTSRMSTLKPASVQLVGDTAAQVSSSAYNDYGVFYLH